MLLSRSILIGSIAAGISMHDIVRDYTLAAHSVSALQQLQRVFTQHIVKLASDRGEQTKAAFQAAKEYATSMLSQHVRAALVNIPLLQDKLVQGWLLSLDKGIAHQVFAAMPSIAVVEELARWLEGSMA